MREPIRSSGSSSLVSSSGVTEMAGTLPSPTTAERVLAGNRRALGRGISMIENGAPGMEALIRTIFPHTGRAFVIGITGPPGAGKSTVVDELLRVIRQAGLKVAVLAVDPNSPFSGGAVLGDRIRMMRHALDEGVFIRSMGARGHLGGLALAATNTIQLLDAAKFDIIIVETVGVGQSELEVAGTADSTVVVIPPGLGDGVQAIKAGIMEIADIFVVNKADHPQSNKTIADIRDLLRMDLAPRPWMPPIVRTVALHNEGIEDLWMRVQQHQHYLQESGELQERRRGRLEREIVEIALRRLRERVLAPVTEGEGFQQALDAVLQRRLNPYEAADQLLSVSVRT